MIVRTASKMCAHLDDFSGKLSSGLNKPAWRFVCEALYGIAARGRVRLSEIGRALEETIARAKTETRLSRNLGRPELVRLATRLIVEEGLEAEVRNAVDRDYYQHGADGGQGHRKGVREGRLKTAEGSIPYSARRATGTERPFRSEPRVHPKGHSAVLEDLAIEMLARGLSVRDIEDAFKDETGRCCCRAPRCRSCPIAIADSSRQIRTSRNQTRHLTSRADFVNGLVGPTVAERVPRADEFILQNWQF